MWDKPQVYLFLNNNDDEKKNCKWDCRDVFVVLSDKMFFYYNKLHGFFVGYLCVDSMLCVCAIATQTMEIYNNNTKKTCECAITIKKNVFKL